MKPLVSVILVSYNTHDLTLRSVASVLSSRGFKPGEIELIVLDNNSSDLTVADLVSQYPQLTVIKNAKNLGFGAGNNQGVSQANGRYILLLNTDAFLAPDSLRILCDSMIRDSSIIAVSPQLRYADGSLQQSSGYFPTPLRVTAWMLWWDKLPLIKSLFSTPYHLFDLSWYNSPHHPDWLMGACVLFRKEEYLAVGGFDEKIFMYSEEVELFLRLKRRFSKTTLFTTATSVIHLGSASTQKAAVSRLGLELQGIEYIYTKHYPRLFWYIRLIIQLGIQLRIMVFSLLGTRGDTLLEYNKYLGHL